MTPEINETPSVTIAVVPRESFGFSCESVDNLYAQTDYPFDLIYIDGNSPSKVRAGLESRASELGFRYIRLDHFLSPNVARNMALREATGKYIVFVDNDIFFTDGWLRRLVDCAEETGAAIVGPLNCIDEPLHENVHNGGGHTWFEEIGDGGLRHIHQQSYLADQSIRDLNAELKRFQCDYVEFHVMLVRRDFFEHVGPLDERLLSTREHIDLCLLAREAGETVICERRSVITYRAGVTPSWRDIAYYMLRWSDAWDLASLEHFRKKWRLAEDEYFEKRYCRLGERRSDRVLRPLLRRLPFGSEPLLRVLQRLERPVNHVLSDRFARTYAFARHSVGLHQPVPKQCD